MKKRISNMLGTGTIFNLFIGAAISTLVYKLSTLFPNDIAIPIQGVAAIIFVAVIINTLATQTKKTIKNITAELKKARGGDTYDNE